MWKQLTVKLNGVSPILMHNGQLANPLNPVVIEMKKISVKRSKTEADLLELARLEFQGSLYMGDNGPVLPAHVLESAIVNGAKKSREGLKAKSGMFIENSSCLEYDGSRDRKELWADENFRFVAPVVINRARIMRTRPIFNDWSATITVNYDDNQVNEASVIKWLQDTGQQVGLCDWRPKYGRFEVEYTNGKN